VRDFNAQTELVLCWQNFLYFLWKRGGDGRGRPETKKKELSLLPFLLFSLSFDSQKDWNREKKLTKKCGNMSRLTPFVKRHHYVSNFTSREINAQWFDCNRVCSLFIPRRIYTSPRILLSFFLFFVWFFFWPRLKRRRARRGDFFSLSRSFGSPFSLLFSSSRVQKKKQKSLSSLYPSFTTNARRNKERETNAREQSSANASPRWKSAAERAERNARRRRFSTLFLVFFFRERRGEALMRREKNRKFFWKERKRKK